MGRGWGRGKFYFLYINFDNWKYPAIRVSTISTVRVSTCSPAITITDLALSSNMQLTSKDSNCLVCWWYYKREEIKKEKRELWGSLIVSNSENFY